jgi:hypothetical protein
MTSRGWVTVMGDLQGLPTGTQSRLVTFSTREDNAFRSFMRRGILRSGIQHLYSRHTPQNMQTRPGIQ